MIYQAHYMCQACIILVHLQHNPYKVLIPIRKTMQTALSARRGKARTQTLVRIVGSWAMALSA